MKTIDISKLKPEQVTQIQSIVEAFKAKNLLEILQHKQVKTDILDDLTEHPIAVDGFLSRGEIYATFRQESI